jgi:hypothetical protein
MPESQVGMTTATKKSGMLKKSSQVESVQKTWDMNTALKNNNFYMIFTMTQYQNVKKNKRT